MSEKENVKADEQKPVPQTLKVKKQQGRYSGEKSKKETLKTETGPRQSRGKKQRRQFKIAPNRG